jgi:hypothetical protein
MNKHKKMECMLVAFLCCTIIVLGQIASAQEGKIIPEKKLQGHQVVSVDAISGINPPSITVNSGTTVIWLNYSRAMVEIQFTDKKVTVACDKPVHFIVDEQGCFVSDKIPLGAVASLCFIEKGIYHYVVKRPMPSTTYSQATEFKGQVVVR